jgi:hypothetical protein
MNPGELLATTAGISRARDSWLLPAVLSTTGRCSGCDWLSRARWAIYRPHYREPGCSCRPLRHRRFQRGQSDFGGPGVCRRAGGGHASIRGCPEGALYAVGFGPFADADRPMAVLVGTLAVAAMATQNALVRLALPGAPSTSVMTTDITQLTVDLATLARGLGRPDDVAKARHRAGVTFPLRRRVRGGLRGRSRPRSLFRSVGVGATSRSRCDRRPTRRSSRVITGE